MSQYQLIFFMKNSVYVSVDLAQPYIPSSIFAKSLFRTDKFSIGSTPLYLTGNFTTFTSGVNPYLMWVLKLIPVG